MFESKLNLYAIQKSAEKKVFWLFSGKVRKMVKIEGYSTNLKLSCAFVNDET